MSTCNTGRNYTEPSCPGQSLATVQDYHFVHSASTTPAPCVPLADFLSMQSAMQDRQLRLETENAHSVCERTAAEQVLQYMLQAAAVGCRSQANTAGYGQCLALHQEIASLKTTVAELRERLHETTSLWVNAFQSQTVTASGRNRSGVYDISPSCPNAWVEKAPSVSNKGIDSVDLLDMDDQMAEADSNRGTNVDDDIEDFAAYAQSPPSIDLSPAQKTTEHTTPTSDYLDILSTESPIVCRFVRNESGSSARFETEEPLLPSQKVSR